MPRGPGQRAGLTRAAVLDTAHALLAEEGLDALTMRALARRLGVAPNALYSHVPGKTELVDALLDDRLSLVEEPAPDAPDPVAALAALMTSTYEVLLTRPGLVPLYLARQGSRGPNAVRLGVAMDALLARLGLAADAMGSARRALILHAIGGAAFASADGPVPADLARADFSRSVHWLLAGIAGGGGPPPRRPPPNGESP
jgi:TetR/AcrR family transcriptional regulator, tetracycline repressor protein